MPDNSPDPADVKFFTYVRSNIFGGKLTQDQVNGLKIILDAWESSNFDDLRWLAYMLGTTFHETAEKIQPIHEYGGDSYFFKMYDIQGDNHQRAVGLGNVQPGDGVKYSGRGYVQLTGRNNYTRMGVTLGIDLVNNPDLAMDPATAAKIMFLGMTQRDHSFTGKILSDYFNDHIEDWVEARKIINGLDHADLIAQTSQKFYEALESEADAPAPVDVPVPAPVVPPPAPVVVAPPAPAPPLPNIPGRTLVDAVVIVIGEGDAAVVRIEIPLGMLLVKLSP